MVVIKALIKDFKILEGLILVSKMQTIFLKIFSIILDLRMTMMLISSILGLIKKTKTKIKIILLEVVLEGLWTWIICLEEVDLAAVEVKPFLVLNPNQWVEVWEDFQGNLFNRQHKLCTILNKLLNTFLNNQYIIIISNKF